MPDDTVADWVSSNEERTEADRAFTDAASKLMDDMGFADGEEERAFEEALGDDEPTEEPTDEDLDEVEESDDTNTDADRGISEDDLEALRRAQYSEDDIAEMTPALASRLAEKAREEKRAGDREYQEYLAQKRKAETDETERPEADGESQPSKRPTLLDLDALSQPFADDLGVEVGAVRNFAEQLTGPLVAQLKQRDGVVNGLATELAIDRLIGDFPELRDPKHLPTVIAKAEAIAASGTARGDSFFGKVQDAMRSAAEIVFKDAVAKRVVKDRETKRSKAQGRAKAQPSTSSRRTTSREGSFESRANRLMDEMGY